MYAFHSHSQEAEKAGLLSIETSLVSIVRSRSARTTQQDEKRQKEKPFHSSQICITT